MNFLDGVELLDPEKVGADEHGLDLEPGERIVKIHIKKDRRAERSSHPAVGSGEVPRHSTAPKRVA